MRFVKCAGIVGIIGVVGAIGCAEGAKYHPHDGGADADAPTASGSGGATTGPRGSGGASAGSGGAATMVGSGGSSGATGSGGMPDQGGTGGTGASHGSGGDDSTGGAAAVGGTSGGNGAAGAVGVGTGGAPGSGNGAGTFATGGGAGHASTDGSGGRSSTGGTGGSSCMACPAPAGGTAVCTGGMCDFTCGSMKKCGQKCIATASGSCCTDQDCPAQAGKTAQCDTSTNTCSYACADNMKPCGTTCIPGGTGSCCANADCSAQCTSCDSATHTCTAVKNGNDPTNRCAGTCDASGACKSKQGQTCSTTTGGCMAGTSCVDNYCCDTSCTGGCMACDITGKQGTCTAIPARAAPHGARAACVGQATSCAGYCDGAGSCSYPTSSCGGGTCAGTGTCQSGVCAGMEPILCNSPPACKLNATCSAGQCSYTQNVPDGTKGAGCSSGSPYCSSGGCVQCLDDSHCSLPTPSCDSSSHKCVCKKKSPGNLLQNPGFDGSQAPWVFDSFSKLNDNVDADGCPGSTSGYSSSIDSDSPIQCISLSPGNYYAGGRFKGGGGSGSLMDVVFYDGSPAGSSNCTGNPINQYSLPLPTPANNWTPAGSSFQAPVGTRCARVGIAGDGVDFDQLYVNTSNQY